MGDTLSTLVDEAATRAPESIAIRIDDDELTYADFHRQVVRAAGALAGHGVGPASRVGLSAGNSVEFAVAVFATLRLGATAVMISTAWHDNEVAHAIGLTDPTHFVHDGSGATDLGTATARPVLRVADLAGDEPHDTAPATVDPDDVAVMVFSSGTTGLPKAVRHSHRSLGHAMRHWVSALGLGAGDRLQVTTPPFHILGLLNLLVVVAAGASVRLHGPAHRETEPTGGVGRVEVGRTTLDTAAA